MMTVDYSRQKPEILIQEYAALMTKAQSNEAWAYSFVGLYFAFLASISVAVGFLLSEVNRIEMASLANPMSVGSFDGYSELVRTTVVVLPILAVVLNVWAIGMVVDYKSDASIILRRLSQIEMLLSGEGAATEMLKNRTVKIGLIWAQRIVVGCVMVLFFLPWVSIVAYMVVK